jgi:putative transposase
MFKVGRMCKVLNISPSGYYVWRKRPESPRSKENRRLEAKIRVLFKDNREVYGSPRIHAELKDEGESCSRNRVARIMRKAGIRAKTKRKFKATTDSRHSFPVAPNLLNQNFETDAPNRIWAGDISYIPTDEGWLYLAILMDLYSRKIIGWSMGKRITRQLVINAFKMATGSRHEYQGAIHHSDRGSQYACNDYQQILKEHDVICSMSRKGNCYDNAVVESFFHSLKTEWVNHHRYRTREEARCSLFDYIENFYNNKRRHSVLNYMNPHEYELYALAA